MLHDDVLNIEEAFGDFKITHGRTSLHYLIEKRGGVVRNTHGR